MCDNTEYYIFLNGFWHGFADKTDANTIDIFEKIFSKTILKNFKITKDFNVANVLFESVFGNTLENIKNWKYKIFFSGEPFITHPKKYKKNDIMKIIQTAQDHLSHKDEAAEVATGTPTPSIAAPVAPAVA